jgi:hypothetical protein
MPDIWDQAYELLIGNGDARLLAQLVAGTSPIPARIRQHLGRMLDPDTDPKTADRLVFSRDPALARKMKTHQKRIQVGLAVLYAEYRLIQSGMKKREAHKRAITAVKNEFKISVSYIEHCVGLAGASPPVHRDFGLRNPPVFGTKKKSTARK